MSVLLSTLKCLNKKVMLKIVDTDYEMEQVKTSPFFDLKLLTVVNEGKSNERFEMKLDGYSMPFESCIDRIVTHRLYLKNISTSLNGFIEEYLKEVENLKNSQVIIKELLETEKEEKDDSDDSD